MKRTEAQIAHLILGFHEGTLSVVEKKQLDALVQQNPDFALDLQAQPFLISPSIQIDSTEFSHPLLEALEIYKNEEGHPFEKLAIGSLEGELNAQEQKIVQSYTQDTHYQKTRKEFAHTRLLPDETIHYPNLNKLLKSAPVRQLNWEPYAMVGSSAAAVLLAIIMIGQSNSDGNAIQTKTRQQARLVPNKKSTQAQTTPIKNTLVEPMHFDQVSKHPHVVGDPPRDCIVQLQFPILEAQPKIQIAQQSSSQAVLPKQIDPEMSSGMNLVQANPSAFQKEPITIKAFLLQKTNEKLFGTAAPSTDLKLETFARYASQTVGIPVQYRVEEMTDSDKIVFQLGRFSMERNRAKK